MRKFVTSNKKGQIKWMNLEKLFFFVFASSRKPVFQNFKEILYASSYFLAGDVNKTENFFLSYLWPLPFINKYWWPDPANIFWYPKRLEDLCSVVICCLPRLTISHLPRRFEDVLKMSWRCLEDVLKTSWRRLGRRKIVTFFW